MECATPGCLKRRTKGRRFCTACAANLDRIALELSEDPHLLFNKRSDAEAGKKTKKVKRPPTCCFVGCFEVRERGERFCYGHRDEGGDD